jgi:hypothetical protein
LHKGFLLFFKKEEGITGLLPEPYVIFIRLNQRDSGAYVSLEFIDIYPVIHRIFLPLFQRPVN